MTQVLDQELAKLDPSPVPILRRPGTVQACSFPFLELPPEIRNMICIYLLDDCVILANWGPKLVVYSWAEIRLPTITNLNQQIQRESSSLFLCRYKFVASFSRPRKPAIPKANEPWISRVAQIHLVRSLDIYVDIRHDCEGEPCSFHPKFQSWAISIRLRSNKVVCKLRNHLDIACEKEPREVLARIKPLIRQLVDDNDTGYLCLANLENIRSWLVQEEKDTGMVNGVSKLTY